MLKTSEDKNFAIFDDYLEESDFRRILAFVSKDDYRPIHNRYWSKSWRLTDGTPFVGTPFWSQSGEGRDPGYVFGSGAPIDPLFRRILGHVDDLKPWLGHEGHDWLEFQLCTYLYPPGSGLSWHDDGERFSGSCIFYAHPIWRSDWGGELLIANETTASLVQSFQPQPGTLRAHTEFASWRPDAALGPDYFASDLREHQTGSGVGVYIRPQPNRMVFLKGGYSHSVKRVDLHAGTNHRCSIAGLFPRP